MKEEIEDIQTLYSFDIIDMDMCRNELTHDYDGEIVKSICHRIVDCYIDLFFEFSSKAQCFMNLNSDGGDWP